ncbi:hypothetical protein T06_16174 [Trichinella sp. T6]|nr:hypothetical protein T06_16174 [Trichinella sp. T6]
MKFLININLTLSELITKVQADCDKRSYVFTGMDLKKQLAVIGFKLLTLAIPNGAVTTTLGKLTIVYSDLSLSI